MRKKSSSVKNSVIKPKLTSELRRHRAVLSKLGIKNDGTLSAEVSEHLKMKIK